MKRTFYFRATIVVIVLLVGLELVNRTFLQMMGEYDRASEIARAQNKNSYIYNGLLQRFDDYKAAQYRIRLPAVVGLGSSRSFDIRSYMFTQSYYGLGGTIDTPLRARIRMASAFSIHRPEAILYSLDYWGFCDKHPDNSETLSALTARLTRLYAPDFGKRPAGLFLYHLLFDGTLRVESFLQLVQQAMSNVSDTAFLGISAKLTHDGFGPDGSFYYLSELPTPADQMIDRTIGGLFDRNYRLASGCKLDDRAVADLLKFVAEIKTANIDLFIFLAPLPRAVLDRMHDANYDFDYISQLRSTLHDRLAGKVEYYDLLDPNSFNGPDCEFRDGLHGGEVTYARMLRSMAREPDSRLSNYVDLARLDRMTEDFDGYRMVAQDDVGERHRSELDSQIVCNNTGQSSRPNG